MAEQSKGDRLWLVLSVATGVAVDVTLNKYSGVLPGWGVLCIWAIPAALFIVWVWKVERTSGWLRSRFLEHPVSYVLMFLSCIPIFWYSTTMMVSGMRAKRPVSSVQQPSRPMQTVTAPQPSAQGTLVPPVPAQAPQRFQRRQKPVPTISSNTPISSPLPLVQPGSTQASPSIPTYSQQCAGSACAQGANSQATYNQYGPPAWDISDSQMEAIAKAMAPYNGITVMIDNIDPSTNSSIAIAQRLSAHLHSVGINIDGPGLVKIIGPSSPWLLTLGTNRVEAAKAFIEALRDEHIVVGKPVDIAPDNTAPPDELYIRIGPYPHLQ
jgi:hypothetical protein